MSVETMPASIRKNAAVLGLFAAITVAIVALIQQGTAGRIDIAREQAQLQALAEILPADSYNNNLLDSSLLLHDPMLGNRTPEPAYLALLDGQPAAIILQATAPDGYSGSIRLLIGILADGSLAGVRVLEHKETPGLGDKIETAKSRWIYSFNGKSLANTASERWSVKKDRGEFDQFAGATITPRAVIRAVHKALQFYDANQAQLFAAAAAQKFSESQP